MIFSVGDQVKFIDEQGEGIVVAVLSLDLVRLDVDGLLFEYNVTDIIKVNESNEVTHILKTDNKRFDDYLIPEQPIEEWGIGDRISQKIFKSISKNGLPIKDLHIEKLVGQPERIAKNKILGIQIQHLEQFIEECHHRGAYRCIVIHGVGEGVLRNEVRKVLRSHGIAYSDADYNEFGAGATQFRVLMT